jgi:flagellar basal-body rod protein FlgG
MPEWPRPLPPRDIDAEAAESSAGPSDPVASETLMFEATQAAIRQARGIHLNNIANARTPGYRRVVVSFTDLAAGDAEPNGDEPRDQASALPGLGIQVASLRLDAATPGAITETGEPLDVAIDGVGFLEVSHHGLPRFTRHGRLTLDAHRRLGIRCGSTIAILQPELALPEDAGAVRITDAGVVEVQSGASETWQPAGTLALVRFLNPSELQSRGQSLLAATPSSGAAQRGEAGKPGYGSFQPGCLEGSNVDVKAEQRAMLSLDNLWESLTRETVEDDLTEELSAECDGIGRCEKARFQKGCPVSCPSENE